MLSMRTIAVWSTFVFVNFALAEVFLWGIIFKHQWLICSSKLPMRTVTKWLMLWVATSTPHVCLTIYKCLSLFFKLCNTNWSFCCLIWILSTVCLFKSILNKESSSCILQHWVKELKTLFWNFIHLYYYYYYNF